MDIVFAIIIIAAGAFSLAGAIFNLDWFMNNYKTKPFMTIFEESVQEKSMVLSEYSL